MKVYIAEDSLKWSKDPKFNDLPETKKYIEGVMASPFWREHFKGVNLLKLGDGRRRAHPCGGPWWGYDGISLKLPRFSRTKMIVLHEMAHGVQPRDTAWHGPEFCQIYVALVYRFMGFDRGEELRKAFVAADIKHTSMNFSLPWWSEAA
jgi:putative metallohydrolase (TIGR04338 family)